MTDHNNPLDHPDVQDFLKFAADNGLADIPQRIKLLKVADSAITVAIVPEEIDLKMALELGLMIWLDKPIVIWRPPGRQTSSRLLKIADLVIDADPSDPASLDQARVQIQEFTARMFGEAWGAEEDGDDTA